MNRHLLRSSSFTFLFSTLFFSTVFIASAAFAQNSATATGGASATVTAGAAVTTQTAIVHPDTGNWFHGSRATGNFINAPDADASAQAEASGGPRFHAFRDAHEWEQAENASAAGTTKFEAWASNHPRMAKAWKFVNDDNFRSSMENKMTPSDKQTIETTVADVKTNIASLKQLKPQFEAARASHDTAAFRT
ncbi:MAG TPA: hypothetical protein VGM92_03270, partial [Candidatus Kapabacteria bacterium]